MNHPNQHLLSAFVGEDEPALRKAFVKAWAVLGADPAFPESHPATAAMQFRIASALTEAARNGVEDPSALAQVAIDICSDDAAKLRALIQP